MKRELFKLAVVIFLSISVSSGASANVRVHLTSQPDDNAVSEQSFLVRVKRALPELIYKSFILNRFHQVKKKSKKSHKNRKTFCGGFKDDQAVQEILISAN